MMKVIKVALFQKNAIYFSKELNAYNQFSPHIYIPMKVDNVMKRGHR